MKKAVLFVLLLTFTLVLSGCKFFYSPRTNTSVEVPFTDWLGEGDTTDVTIYFHEKEEVPYITLHDFLTISASNIDTEAMTWQQDPEAFRVDYFDETLEEELVLTYERATDSITVNHFEFFTHQYTMDPYLPDNYYLEERLDLSTRTLSDGVTMPLGDYGLSPIYDDGHYQLPLALANLLFSDYGYGIYFTGEELYSLSYWNNFTVDILDSSYVSEEVPLDLRAHIFEYLAFYFEYFYGLTHEQEDGYYRDLFLEQRDLLLVDDYFDNERSSTTGFYQSIDRILTELDDLHLWFEFEGYYGESYDFDALDYISSGRTLATEEYEVFLEDHCMNSVSRNLGQGIVVLFLDDFEDYASNIFATEVDVLVNETTTDIVIDLSCNGGGYVSEFMDLLPYFTDDPIVYYLKNFAYGGEYTYVFESTIDKLDARIYVRTSPLTYSAGHLFASYLHYHDLALLFGENTSGGSSFTDTLFAPGGMIINAPVLVHDTNANGDYLEHGLSVAWQVSEYDDTRLIQFVLSQRP
jgi:hypothetical protein